MAPRSIDELTAIFQTVTAAAATPSSATPAAQASPAPFVLPSGQPADDATAAAVTATMRELAACINAGDFGRVFALFTDHKLKGDFIGDVQDGLTINDLVNVVKNVSPAPESARLAAPIVSDVRILNDGRAGAFVTGDDGQGNGVTTSFIIFVKQDDQWLIDESYDLLATT